MVPSATANVPYLITSPHPSSVHSTSHPSHHSDQNETYMSMTAVEIQESWSDKSHVDHDSATSKHTSVDSIRTFFDCLVMKVSDSMPDNSEFHLPHLQKQEVYSVYRLDFSRLYPSDGPAFLYFFMSTWNNHCIHVKCRLSPCFQKCAKCEWLRVAIQNAVNESRQIVEPLRQQRVHHDFIARGRLRYRLRTELAKEHPSKYLSITVDEADQSKIALPRFVTPRKDQRGNVNCNHLIGVIKQALIPHL